MHRIVYTLVTNKYATLKELQTYYTIYDAIALYEACLVSLHNRVVGIDSQRKNTKK